MVSLSEGRIVEINQCLLYAMQCIGSRQHFVTADFHENYEKFCPLHEISRPLEQFTCTYCSIA
jgi:hypothetical protein